jgi:chitin synthase
MADGGINEEEVGGEEGDVDSPSDATGIKCVAGEFQSALDTLFATLDDTNPWYVFNINPNDAQLPNQLEGRGVKAQVRSIGLSDMAKKAAQGVFEATMSPVEFCNRYRDQLNVFGVQAEDEPIARVVAMRDALGLAEKDIVIGKFKVSYNCWHIRFGLAQM